ncbi:uncharacterized protein LOC115692333 [Syzygium oleosum]|uniref:uncharacterized protein LOC115692333 n=1 Tax=Syzygium oleosum TaxID=219896 RepID=UPI0011D2A3D8|nr:uncharacterized protein LOC115692333 [Syzygium oleosum]
MACTNASQQVQTNGDQTLEELNKQHANLLERLKIEKRRAEELKHIKLLKIENLSFNELMVVKKSLEDLKKVVDRRRMELLASEASSSTPCPRAIDASMISQINDKGCDSRGAEAGDK